MTEFIMDRDLLSLLLYLPADEPLGCVFKGNEDTEDGPVHCPSLELGLTERTMGKGLKSCVTGEKKCKPGAETRNQKSATAVLDRTYQRIWESNDINMVEVRLVVW